MTNTVANTKIRIMWVTLLASILLMVIKFFTYFLTNSNAILTDAVESLVNIAAGSFALYSIYFAAKPKDTDHPYGHGKIEFFSAGVEGGMILLAGAAMIVKGIVAFIKRDIVNAADIGAYLSAFSGIVNWIMGTVLIKKGKKFNSTLMMADGKHLIADTISSIGLVIGLALIYFTKIYWIDYLITLLFGIFIVYTGIKLVKESFFDLLDKADKKRLNKLVILLNEKRDERWIDMHNLRVLKYGAHLHVDCHLTLPWYYTLEESHTEMNKVEKLVEGDPEQEIEFFIHADPCLPTSCAICTLKSCQYRKHSFVKRLEWNLTNVLPNQKHSLSNS